MEEDLAKPSQRYRSFLGDYASTTPGSPGGAMLRAYWHPLCLSEDLRDLPYPVRMLGEDLVAFRTPTGEVGLVAQRCPHRGASLAYGQVREAGIQCSYHGWTFDAGGHCTAMPLEPVGSRLRHSIKQPAYRVEEWGGLVWCYMGREQDSPPPLPKIDLLARTDGQVTVQRGVFFPGPGGGMERFADTDIRNYSYLSFLENIVDMSHIYALHMIAAPDLPKDLEPYCDLSVDSDWQSTVYRAVETSYGMKSVVVHDTARPRVKFVNTISIALPTTYRFSGLGARKSDFCDDRRESGGLLRIIDDEHFEVIRIMLLRPGNYRHAGALPSQGEGATPGLATAMKGRFEKKPYDSRAYAGWEGNLVLEDLVMQESQGVIPDRTLDHLTASDAGVAMLRRIWQRSFEAMAAGGEPKPVAVNERGVVEIDTFKGFLAEEDLELGPNNLPSSEDGRGLIRNELGKLVFA